MLIKIHFFFHLFERGGASHFIDQAVLIEEEVRADQGDEGAHQACSIGEAGAQNDPVIGLFIQIQESADGFLERIFFH